MSRDEPVAESIASALLELDQPNFTEIMSF
jgi:hypothetical protein